MNKKHKCIIVTLLMFLAFTSLARDIKGDANSDGRVSVADIAAIASHILGRQTVPFDEKAADANEDGRISVADITILASIILGKNSDETAIVNPEPKDTLYVRYENQDVSVYGGEGQNVQIEKERADLTLTIGKQPNIVIRISGESNDGRLRIIADTCFTLQLAGINLTSSHAPAINSCTKQKMTVELPDNTENIIADGEEYSLSDSTEKANACLCTQGNLTLSGKGSVKVYGRSKHGISSGKGMNLEGGDITVLEAKDDAIHSGKYIRINGSDLTLKGQAQDGMDAKEEVLISSGRADITVTGGGAKAIKTDTDFRMTDGEVDITLLGDNTKGIKSKGSIDIKDGTVKTVAKGKISVKDGEPSYCTILKSDADITVHGGFLLFTHEGEGGKCISADKDILILGGQLNMETHGNGGSYISAEGETDYYTAKCMSADHCIRIISGEITCKSAGSGAKGIVAEESLFLGSYESCPVVNIETHGSSIVNDTVNDVRYGCPKAIKSCRELYVYSGTINISTKGMGGEGLECNGCMNIFGGDIQCLTFDDGINVGESLEINGGNILCFSDNNDGIDSNGRITISGGRVVSMSNSILDESFDTELGQLYISGGKAFGLSPSDVAVSTTSVAYYTTPVSCITADRTRLSGFSVTKDKYYSVCDKDGNVIMSTKSLLTSDHVFFFISNELLNEGQTYYVYESSSVSSPSFSLFSSQYTEGGKLPADTSLILTFEVTSKPNHIYQQKIQL